MTTLGEIIGGVKMLRGIMFYVTLFGLGFGFVLGIGAVVGVEAVMVEMFLTESQH